MTKNFLLFILMLSLTSCLILPVVEIGVELGEEAVEIYEEEENKK